MTSRVRSGRGGGALLLALSAALSAALVLADVERRAEMSPVPFVMGSRYGRSTGPRLMAARNDRFFMGSRYGKRSEGWSGGGGGIGSGWVRAGETVAGVAAVGAVGDGARALLCEYTGVFPLYRCVRHIRRPQLHDKSAAEERPGETE